MNKNKITFIFNNDIKNIINFVNNVGLKNITKITIAFHLNEGDTSKYYKNMYNNIFINSDIFEKTFIENYNEFWEIYNEKTTIILNIVVIITILSDNITFTNNIINNIENIYNIKFKEKEILINEKLTNDSSSNNNIFKRTLKNITNTTKNIINKIKLWTKKILKI